MNRTMVRQVLECGGRAKRRHRFPDVRPRRQSGVALRFPPHSKTLTRTCLPLSGSGSQCAICESWRLCMNFDSGTQPSGCGTTGTSTHCSLKATFLSPSRFLHTMRGLKLWKLPLNFEAADVSPLHLKFRKVRADPRRLLRFRDSKRGRGDSLSLSQRERAGERVCLNHMLTP